MCLYNDDKAFAWRGIAGRMQAGGRLYKITLCISRIGLFFSGTSETVVAVGVQRLFALQGRKGSKPPQERGWLCALGVAGLQKV